MTFEELVVRLRERLSRAEADAKSSSGIAMNSYGAGYDAGFVAALREVMADAMGGES